MTFEHLFAEPFMNSYAVTVGEIAVGNLGVILSFNSVTGGYHSLNHEVTVLRWNQNQIL